MKTRRLAVAGLVILAMAAMGTAGCTNASSSGTAGSSSAAASPSPSPATAMDTVLAAVKKLGDTSYKYTLVTGGLSGQGAVDPAGKKVALTLAGVQSGVSITWDMILITPDYWMKIDFGGKNAALGLPSGKWMHIDQTKIKNSAGFGIDPSRTDPTRSSGLFNGMTDAKRIDATHYTVTLDLTKTTDSAIDPATVTKLGDKARTVPATVVLDDQGRLAQVSLDLSSVDPQASITSTYSDYGTPVSVSAPAASDTVEAPDAVYRIFNGG
ncbi:MAG: hypothetical protein E6G35_04140 [Actinobacteria bacterium]|nr:MAG: hypothetical protein E6G35_04140 [Actinomycetota bacterium]